MSENVKYTPMMMQYLEHKKNYQDCIVFYRLGDFYEMFFDDALTASKELDLVLTGRNAGVEDKVPMCGIPHHAANGYIQRLTQKGYKVAIIEQLEDPSMAKGIVKRGCIKIVTPGTIMDENANEKESNYIATLIDYQFGMALALCEMTTGECLVQLLDRNVNALTRACLSYHIREIVLPSNFEKRYVKLIEDLNTITISIFDELDLKDEYRHLVTDLQETSLIKAVGLLTNYLDETQKAPSLHLLPFKLIHDEESLQMDYATRSNLELVSPLRANSKSITLWQFLDHCKSAMGSRLLRKWVEHPLINISDIQQRQTAIDFLNSNFITKDELGEALSKVYDLERLCARIAYGSANPRDCVRLQQTLSVIPEVFNLFGDCPGYEYLKDLDCCEDLCQRLDGAFVSEPPNSIKDGNIFVQGYNAELDELKEIGKSGQNWILELEAKEKEKTQIKTLKIGYNRVFGYYIEVSKSYIGQLKEEFGYIRKQTLANAERYVTQELKEKEEQILHAQEKSIRLEMELFMQLIDECKLYLNKLHQLAESCALIDALYSLAIVSNENGYVCPQFTKESRIELHDARHPILETVLKGNRYIANDLIMDEKDHILLITGPNMGGKSTYMRQCAALVILAQMGCYVPAKKAVLPIFDQIFTRIGASDDIMSGQSTFMVEMMEANYALTHATKNSLILFDEIGRGTSTYDGMSLAHAMIEYINQNIQAKTLFSTHYHELTALEEKFTGIKNAHVQVHEENDHVTFLYKVAKGKADKSYGINVARLAKLPESILERANQILKGLESQQELDLNLAGEFEFVDDHSAEKEALIDELADIDVDQLSARDALNYLYQLKDRIKKMKG